MASRRFACKPPDGLCSTLGAGDGLDPRLELRGSRSKLANRKAWQLCRQVERILSIALEGDLIRDLTVQSVIPAPDSSRLLATLTFDGPDAATTAEILAALASAHAQLRGAIALGIHRRKTPELAFHVARR